MNRKLFTLAAALMLGSAFTVNAQTQEAATGTKLDGSTYYYLGCDLGGGNIKYLVGNQLTRTSPAKSCTTLDATEMGLGTRALALWKVEIVTINGVQHVQLTNKSTKEMLVFDSTPTIANDVDAAYSTLVWAGLADADTDGKLDYALGGGVLTINGKQLLRNATGTTWSIGSADGVATFAATIQMYVENNGTPVPVATLNGHLGNGFSFKFVDADPQPATNIFGQKLHAFTIDNTMATTVGSKYFGYAQGTYFALAPKPDVAAGSADEYNWFQTTQFVAVSPTKHMGIPSYKQENGEGFDLITVYGKDLKVAAPKGSEIASANAAFTVTNPAPENEPNNYAISVSPLVKKKSSEDPSAAGPLNVVVTSVLGANYVTVAKDAAAKVKFSDTNLVAVKDILKKDGASVYNILFTSGADQTATNPTEYGKYLGYGVTTKGGALGLLAQGPAYVDPNNAEMQWVITAANKSASKFTFENRESGVKFETTLRKTEKEGVYEIAATAGAGLENLFSAAYYGENGYEIKNALNLSGKTVELKPATVDKTAGYADYSEEELSQLVKMQFSVGSKVLSKDIYVGVKVNAADTKATMFTSQDITDAAQWEIVKRTGIADTIYSKMTYAYLDKDGNVAADKDFENHEIVTYSIRLYKDGNAFYYNGATPGGDDLEQVPNKLLAPRVAIKENVDGTVSLICVGTKVDYSFGKVALGLSGAGALVYGEDIYANEYTTQKSYFYFGTEEATPSLEAVARHASFSSVNGGFLGVGAEGDAIIAATKDEAQELTFWLDTADVEKYTPSFYISQGIKAETKADAAEVRNFLFNAKDSVNYYDEGTASTITDSNYKLNSGETKAIFKAGTLVNKDSLNTIVAGKEVGLNNANGLRNFKFNIVLADTDVADEYVIKSVADGKYLGNINGKVAMVDDTKKALVVSLGEGDATANEAIAAESGVQVIGGQGVVTVQGAAGKVITVANILGQTIANQVATSDNVTIAVPAGIAVVAVDGEATKVVVK